MTLELTHLGKTHKVVTSAFAEKDIPGFYKTKWSKVLRNQREPKAKGT